MKKNWYIKDAQYSRIKDLYEIEDENSYYENPRVLDVDTIDEKLPLITEEEAMENIADEYIEQDEEEYVEDIYKPPEIPIEVTEEEVPEFTNTADAMRWAIENNKVVRINYKTSGTGRGRGRILKREVESKDITRIVEPHEMFVAKTTGNTILVTYDRSVRAIRAFIVDNILNYIFTDKEFKKRMRVMPSSNKGIIAMDNDIFKNLKNAVNELSQNKLEKSADVISNVMKDLVEIKTAQYVGAQGYWIRNKRCWDNCYRQKRTASPNMAAQNVWMECWKEYNASINDDNSGWEKYANDTRKVVIASKKQKDWVQKENKKFASIVKEKISDNMDGGEAIYKSLKECSQKYLDIMIKNASNVLEIAETLKNNGYEELGEKLANISSELIKKADFGGSFFGNLFKGKWTPRQRLINRLGKIMTRIQEMVRSKQGNPNIDTSTPPTSQNVNTPTSSPQAETTRYTTPSSPGFGSQFVAHNIPTPGQVATSIKSNKIQKESQQPASPTAYTGYESEYMDFLKDLQEESVILSKLVAKGNPNVQSLARDAVQGINHFLQFSNNNWNTGKRNFADIESGLNQLSTNVSSALTGLRQIQDTPQEQAVAQPEQEIETTEPTGAIEPPGSTSSVDELSKMINDLKSTLSREETRHLISLLENRENPMAASSRF